MANKYQIVEFIFLGLMMLLHIIKIVFDLRKINIVFSISNQNRFKS